MINNIYSWIVCAGNSVKDNMPDFVGSAETSAVLHHN